MTTRTVPPSRADHVGSLLRPPELAAAREEHWAGRIGAAELRLAEDDAIRGAVARQQRVGLQSVTDGEFRRGSWHMDFIYQLGGVERAEGAFTSHFRNEHGEITFTPAGKCGFSSTVEGNALTLEQEIAKHELVVETAAEAWG